jgi:hypothetical protein
MLRTSDARARDDAKVLNIKGISFESGTKNADIASAISQKKPHLLSLEQTHMIPNMKLPSIPKKP